MITTNYEISKKLEEAGFSRQPFWIWTSEQCCAPYQTNYDGFRSYDLETILNALPKKIEFKEKEYCFWMQWSGSSDCYLMGYVHGNLRATELEVWREDENKNSESLADTAGRMWLELKKKNLL